MRERTVNQVIANISRNNAILQIVLILILILFGQVTYAWSWWTCLGANVYTLTVEKLFPDPAEINCYTKHGTTHPGRNDTFVEYTFCGSYDWFGETDPWYCIGIWKYPACDGGFVQRGFDAFNEDFDCAEGKEAYCHWQLHKEYLTLYNPKKNKSEKHYYKDTSCPYARFRN
jgi:hypothetical protein